MLSCGASLNQPDFDKNTGWFSDGTPRIYTVKIPLKLITQNYQYKFPLLYQTIYFLLY